MIAFHFLMVVTLIVMAASNLYTRKTEVLVAYTTHWVYLDGVLPGNVPNACTFDLHGCKAIIFHIIH